MLRLCCSIAQKISETILGATISQGYLRVALVFVWGSGLPAGCNFHFQEFFASILLVLTKFSFWRGQWALGYRSAGFGDFLSVC